MSEKQIINIILIGIGGCIGSISRYLVGVTVHRLLNIYWFPVGTLAVNVVGCFLIGLIGGILEIKQVNHAEIKFFLFTGILGGFTTFSAFGYETFNLYKDGFIFLSILNPIIQVILGLAAVWCGYFLSKLI
ncbi:MAG: fluoride efflux transporter CrcB [Thermodesulfovibrionales bacterium]|nr:fluoride efflux transporter CrcB [Thermodesulfovibrionales bacterium]